MRALVQRVSNASVTVEGKTVGEIGRGLLIFVGIHYSDTAQVAEKLADKVVQLRIFPDEDGRMNRSLLELSGGLLIISQFTLYANTSRGNRPSYSAAANPQEAEKVYTAFVDFCRRRCTKVETGIFQAHMEVLLVNDGPVTIILDSENTRN